MNIYNIINAENSDQEKDLTKEDIFEIDQIVDEKDFPCLNSRKDENAVEDAQSSYTLESESGDVKDKVNKSDDSKSKSCGDRSSKPPQRNSRVTVKRRNKGRPKRNVRALSEKDFPRFKNYHVNSARKGFKPNVRVENETFGISLEKEGDENQEEQEKNLGDRKDRRDPFKEGKRDKKTKPTNWWEDSEDIFDWNGTWVDVEYLERSWLQFLTNYSFGTPNTRITRLPPDVFDFCMTKIPATYSTYTYHDYLHKVNSSIRKYISRMIKFPELFRFSDGLMFTTPMLEKGISAVYFLNAKHRGDSHFKMMQVNADYHKGFLDNQSTFKGERKNLGMGHAKFFKWLAIGTIAFVAVRYYFKPEKWEAHAAITRRMFQQFKEAEMEFAKRETLFELDHYRVPNTKPFLTSELRKVSNEQRQFSDKKQLIPYFDTFSILIEETIKCLPYGYKLVAKLEKLLWNKDTEDYHRRNSCYPFAERVFRHMYDNSTPIVKADIETEYSVRQRRRGKKCQIPFNAIGKCMHPLPGRSFGYQENFETDDYYGKTNYIYPACLLVSSMARPNPHLSMYWISYSMRVEAIPNNIKESHDALFEVSKLFIVEPETIPFQDWFHKLRAIQKRRVLKSLDEIQNNIVSERVTIHLKTDEMIPSAIKFVPRIIFNISGDYFTLLGKITYEISHYMEKKWSPEKIYHLEGFHFRILFAHGATGSSLGKAWTIFKRSDCVSFMVMGDDMLLCDGETVIESDFSKFDRTQGTDILRVFFSWLEYNGLSELAYWYRKMYQVHKSMRYKSKEFLSENLFSPKVVMRQTGEPATCLANSLINIVTTMKAYIANKNDLADGYSLFGLKAKVSYPKYPTFLKGVFLENVEGTYSWVRLPSFLLKAFKSFTNPTLIFKKVPYVIAYRMLIYAQWKGYGAGFASNWFYKEIEKLVYRWSIANSIDYKESSSVDYQPISDQVPEVEEHVFNSFLENRYGIYKSELISYLEHLEEAMKIVPSLISHDLSVKLEADYL